MKQPVLAAGAALLLFAVAIAGAAGAPTYTDWSAPVNAGATLNTTFVDAGPALSANGLSLFFYSDRPGGSGGSDIWVTRRATAGDAWGTPVNLGPTVNSTASDFVPALSLDGHWLFIASGRPGGVGANDVWASWRPDTGDDFGWQAPTNLGPGVNTTSNEQGVGYFENPGGRPQLFLSTSRPGGLGLADLWLSELQADGSWGPAVLIPELSTSGSEARATIRHDGLEIFFFSNRPGSTGASEDLWTATRDSVAATWSTPVNLGPTVNSANETQPSLSADARTIFFASNRTGGSGNFDLYMTTRDARLSMTANNQSRLFGQANPPLTYAVTGFVGGDTSAVVSGTAACTTTATPYSPAGTYPIACTAGTLGAAGYVFATFVPGTLTVTYSSPCLTGPRTGPLTVSAGQAICIGAAGAQTGPVTVMPGGSLDVEGGRITGPLTTSGAAAVRLCGATLTGPLTISGSTGLVLVGGDAATGPCDPNAITGRTTITGNTGGVEFNGNTVVGPLRITDNTGSLPSPDPGSVHASGNSVTGPVRIQ